MRAAWRGRRLSELRGKVVLLDFWATWCGPCVAEIPFLRADYGKYRSRGFEILGLNNDEKLEAAKIAPSVGPIEVRTKVLLGDEP